MSASGARSRGVGVLRAVRAVTVAGAGAADSILLNGSSREARADTSRSVPTDVGMLGASDSAAAGSSVKEKATPHPRHLTRCPARCSAARYFLPQLGHVSRIDIT